MLFVFFGFGQVSGQVRTHVARVVDAKIDLKGTHVNGAFVEIKYELPFSGMVEIRLYDGSGQQVWQNQYDHNPGENKIILKASKFHPGETYTYALNYKRDEVRETIIVPPGSFD